MLTILLLLSAYALIFILRDELKCNFPLDKPSVPQQIYAIIYRKQHTCFLRAICTNLNSRFQDPRHDIYLLSWDHLDIKKGGDIIVTAVGTSFKLTKYTAYKMYISGMIHILPCHIHIELANLAFSLSWIKKNGPFKHRCRG